MFLPLGQTQWKLFSSGLETYIFEFHLQVEYASLIWLCSTAGQWHASDILFCYFFCHNIIMFRLKATLAKRLRSVFINIYIYCILLNQPQKHFLLKHQRKIHLFNCLSLHIQDVPKKQFVKIAGFWLNFLQEKYNKRSMKLSFIDRETQNLNVRSITETVLGN